MSSEAEGVVINDPQVVAEISALFVAYDLALMSNDVEKLTAFFWDSPLVIRYGTAENLYGSEALRAFRATRSTKDLSRLITRMVITTFGCDFATANAEYRTVEQGRLGRQSQTWCRLPEGWRVVAAHVSLLPLEFL